MTSPVLQERAEPEFGAATPVAPHPDGEGWTVSFFLSNTTRADEAPQPEDPSIRLVMEPETIIGALRYSGNNTGERREDSKARLLETIARDGRWRVVNDVTWAQYDQPFAIPFLKRNEAQVAIEPVSA